MAISQGIFVLVLLLQLLHVVVGVSIEPKSEKESPLQTKDWDDYDDGCRRCTYYYNGVCESYTYYGCDTGLA
jgi:hypothetical protein